MGRGAIPKDRCANFSKKRRENKNSDREGVAFCGHLTCKNWIHRILALLGNYSGGAHFVETIWLTLWKGYNICSLFTQWMSTSFYFPLKSGQTACQTEVLIFISLALWRHLSSTNWFSLNFNQSQGQIKEMGKSWKSSCGCCPFHKERACFLPPFVFTCLRVCLKRWIKYVMCVKPRILYGGLLGQISFFRHWCNLHQYV